MLQWGSARRFAVVAVMVGALVGPLGAAEAIAASRATVAQADPAETSSPPDSGAVYGYYRTPWASNPAVYESRTDGSIRKLSRAAWAAMGSPRVEVAPVTYVRTSWSTSVYALVTWPSAADDTTIDHVIPLAGQKLRSVGSPRPAVVGHVPTTTYWRYASGPRDLYAATPDGAAKLLTSAERVRAGSPSATRVVEGGYYRVAWSKRISFVTPNGSRSHIDARRHALRGKPHVAVAPTIYARTPWSKTIHALITWPNAPGDRRIDQVVRLSSAHVAAAGRPAITVRHRIPGDAFVRLPIGRTIYHRLSGTLTPVTWTQWRGAGSPKLGKASLTSPMYIRGILIVNKSIPLPKSYGNGLRPELTSAFSKMRAAARADGVSLNIISGFRSYASQAAIYPAKIRQYGYDMAQLRSARPGHSEHQTGLAIDVNSISQAWGDTKAGRWVAKHGHRYGFIVRYPKGKTSVTGYAYEPWHLRHVGVDVATHLYKTGLTLDEYLGVPSVYR